MCVRLAPRLYFSLCGLLAAGFLLGEPAQVTAQLIPGMGKKMVEVGDDFEDAEWGYTANLPKSSSNIDKQPRWPAGFSNNSRWVESGFRGQPDIVRRVDTPDGGIPGSKGALYLRSLHTGVPGTFSYEMQQDDFMASVSTKIGGFLPVTWSPSVVVRVYLFPFDQWEDRTGASFALRADCETFINKTKRRGFSRRTFRESEAYWPGMFIQFNSKTDPKYDEDSAMFVIRSGDRGQDLSGPIIKEPGWWTLGMSFTPDGQVHYYARKGVGNLTAADHITSQFPYGYRCERLHTFFFNIVNQDDGRSWSTPWIIDDPAVYVIRND